MEIYNTKTGFVLQTKQQTIAINDQLSKADVRILTQKIADDLLINRDLHSFDSAGEYEVGNTSILGYELSNSDSIAFLLNLDNFRVGVILNWQVRDLQLLSEYGFADLDLIIVDIGENKPADFIKLINQLSPVYIVISNSETKLADVLKELSQTTPETVERVKLARKDLPETKENFLVLS